MIVFIYKNNNNNNTISILISSKAPVPSIKGRNFSKYRNIKKNAKEGSNHPPETSSPLYDDGGMTFHVLPRLTDAQMLNDQAKNPLKIRVGCAACFQKPSPYFRPKQESISWNLSCVVHVQKENKTNKANVTCWNVKTTFPRSNFRTTSLDLTRWSRIRTKIDIN